MNWVIKIVLLLLPALALASPWASRAGSPSTTPSAVQQPVPSRTSPFEMVRWNDQRPEVLVAGTWWRLDAIDGIACETILSDARRLYGEDWAKRFCEDLVELLTRSGHPPTKTATLSLTDLADATSSTLREARWSAENRRRIRDARPRPASATDSAGAAIPRIERERANVVPPAFEALVRRLDAVESSGARLTRAQAAADLAQLEWLVEHTYAYRDRTGFDTARPSTRCTQDSASRSRAPRSRCRSNASCARSATVTHACACRPPRS